MRGSLGPAALGLLLGVAAGVLFRVSDIALKYLTGALHGGAQGIVREWTLVALAASVLAFYASARAFQLGLGVIGPIIAFGLVIVGAAFMPAPVRAGRAGLDDMPSTFSAAPSLLLKGLLSPRPNGYSR